MTSNEQEQPPQQQRLPFLTDLTDLLSEEEAGAKFFPDSRNINRQMAKYRTREERPMPYVRIGQKCFYIADQVVQWVNEEQAAQVDRERAIQAAIRRIG